LSEPAREDRDGSFAGSKSSFRQCSGNLTSLQKSSSTANGYKNQICRRADQSLAHPSRRRGFTRTAAELILPAPVKDRLDLERKRDKVELGTLLNY
jgi:hypothetical protein